MQSAFSVMPLTLASLLVTAQLSGASVSPYDVLKRATLAVERDSASQVELQWRRTLARDPGNVPATVGLATLARLTFRFARAESLFTRVIEASGDAPNVWRVVARQGIAGMLAAGRTPALADSAFVVARNEARQLGLPRAEAELLVNLGSLRARTAGTRAALDLIAESRRVFPELPPREEAQRSCIEGSFASRMGLPEVERRLATGRALAKRHGEWRAFAECTLMVAQLSEHRGYFNRALLELDTAITYMRRTRAYSSLAIALQWGAFVRFQTGDISRARADYVESVTLSRRTGNAAVEAWALTGLAQIAIVLGDLSGGRAHLEAATTLHRARNDRWGYATVRELEGELNDALGDIDGARNALNEAVAVQTQMGQQLLAVAPLRRLARLELAQGNIDDAEKAIERATQHAIASRDEGWGRELEFHLAGIAMARGKLDLADSLLGVIDIRLKERPNPTADLEYSFAIRSADLAARRGEWQKAEQLMARALAVIDAWRGYLDDKDVRMRASQARMSWGTIGAEMPGLIARLVREGRLQSSFALSEGARARELASVAVQRAAIDPNAAHLKSAIASVRNAGKPASLTQLQASLDDETAALAYVAGHGSSPTTVYVVTRTTATARLLAPIDSIAPTLERYLRLAGDGADASALARRLGEVLLSDALDAVPATVRRLMIIPELMLYRVPFDALQMTSGRHVVERFTIHVVPSASFAVLAARETGSNPAGTLVAFGDALNETMPGQFGAERGSGSVQSLPRLRYSGDEARRVAQYSTGSRVLVRGAASENALRRSDLRNVRVLHFATHALMDDRSLPRNVLVLSPSAGSDGFVGPQELSGLLLRNALVVLSGCSTVGGVVLGGEGLRGLTAPLLEAGARAVVATHWAIGDESTLPFIDRFYAHMARGSDVATALQRAKQDAIRDRVPSSVWAAFSLVGDGTMKVALKTIPSPLLPWTRASQGN